jgi:hypothetical protein
MPEGQRIIAIPRVIGHFRHLFPLTMLQWIIFGFLAGLFFLVLLALGRCMLFVVIILLYTPRYFRPHYMNRLISLSKAFGKSLIIAH